MKNRVTFFILLSLLGTVGLLWSAENPKEKAIKALPAVDATAIKSELSSPILYISRRQYAPDHHNTATIFQKGEINHGSFAGGGAMKIWYPETNKVTTLLTVPEGIVRDPTISYDAKKVIFSFRKSKDDDYHIGEMELKQDRPTLVVARNDTPESLAAKGIRQLTRIQGASDIDPIYLPDGNIVFASTREPKYCMCNRHIMCNLYLMNADGSNIQQIGKSTLFEGHPSMMSDGRILYDRWEYVDRNFGDAQGVWVTNPDGTKHEIFWGNNTAVPGGVIDTRIMPESDSLFVCTFGSCHDRPWGAIALVDRRLGLDGKEPVLETWPANAIQIIDNSPGTNPMKEVARYDRFHSVFPKLEDPCPISDDFFLAAGMTGEGESMAIWLLQRGGKMSIVHKDPENCFDPTPIVEMEPPRVIGSRIDLSKSTGSFYVSNVYQGQGMEKVQPGTAKYIRVVESPEKRFWTGNYWSKGNGTQAPCMSWDDFNNKRILGTVEIEKDGSAFFEVPAEKYLYFQLLDKDGVMIQSMRSGIMTRPGETNGCVGCHESRLDAPASSNLSPKAMSGPPKKLKDWYGPARLFSYVSEVQPVFDRFCITCHDIGKPAGEKLLLNGDLNLAFNTSYFELRSKALVNVPGAGPHNLLPALTWGARQSRLGNVLLNGHPDPKIDAKRKELGLWFNRESNQEAFDRIMTWIDINAPYYPTYASAYPATRFGRAVLNNSELNRLEALTGIKLINPNNSHYSTTPSLDCMVNLSHPEKSACLKKWADDTARKSSEYQEALALIQKGTDRLKKQSRGEDENFKPVTDNEISKQQRYDRFQKREQSVRNAIIKNQKVFDN